jgi:inosine-uridine nucleoside N-ribohydrolase
MWYEATQPVLIDTDIGDDVDDAFGLALALRLPRLRVRAVTTVAGPVEARARLAQLILAAAGHADVPVAPGSSAMSDGRAGSARFSHEPMLGLGTRDWGLGASHLPSPISHPPSPIPHPPSPIPHLPSPISHPPSATDLILACSQRYFPLTIVALGPLTNIAAALERDPALARRARLVAMAGTLGYPYPDWNLRCDPAAARRVLAAGMPITLVGMHVTMRAKMRAEQLRRLFASRDELGMTLARCVLAWRTWKRRLPILHDALTVAVAADPTLARLAPRRVHVGSRGFSLAARLGAPNALVCAAAGIERFHALLEAQLLGGAPAPAERCGPWCRLLRLIA